MAQAARLAPPLGGAWPKERILTRGACADSGHVICCLPSLGGRWHQIPGRRCGPGARARRSAGEGGAGAECACAEVSVRDRARVRGGERAAGNRPGAERGSSEGSGRSAAALIVGSGQS